MLHASPSVTSPTPPHAGDGSLSPQPFRLGPLPRATPTRAPHRLAAGYLLIHIHWADYHRFVLVFVFFFSPFLPSFSITRKTGMRVPNDRIMWPRLPGHHNNIIIIIIVIISCIFSRRLES